MEKCMRVTLLYSIRFYKIILKIILLNLTKHIQHILQSLLRSVVFSTSITTVYSLSTLISWWKNRSTLNAFENLILPHTKKYIYHLFKRFQSISACSHSQSSHSQMSSGHPQLHSQSISSIRTNYLLENLLYLVLLL